MKVTAATRPDSIHAPKGAVTRDQRSCMRMSVDGEGKYVYLSDLLRDEEKARKAVRR